MAFKSRDGSPFECEKCGERDREPRNCLNRKRLSDEARAVEAYTPSVLDELQQKNATKVASLGDLRLYECPTSFITGETFEVMRLVLLIEGSGQLLHEGGWGGQPFWLVEAYEIYRAERIRERNGLKNIEVGK